MRVKRKLYFQKDRLKEAHNTGRGWVGGGGLIRTGPLSASSHSLNWTIKEILLSFIFLPLFFPLSNASCGAITLAGGAMFLEEQRKVVEAEFKLSTHCHIANQRLVLIISLKRKFCHSFVFTMTLKAI